MAIRVVLFLIVAAALAAALFYSQQSDEPLVVSGFIEADEIRVGSRVGGRIKRVAAEEGMQVAAGAVLIELEPFDLLQRKTEAHAKLDAASADLQRLERGFRKQEVAEAKARVDRLQAQLDKLINGPRDEEIVAASARLEAAEAELRLAEQNFQRTETLRQRGGAATEEQLEQAAEQQNAARANQVVRAQEYELLRKGSRKEDIAAARAQLDEASQVWQLRVAGFRPEEIAQAKATQEAAAAALAAIEQQIKELAIKAPVDGVIEAVELRPGDLVAAGAPVLSLMDTSHLWIRAYVPEDRLNLKLGQAVEVAIDSFPDRRFQGEVTFISRQAEFTPRNVQTPDERSKQVFRIKVTLTDGLDLLRPGMAGDVFLDSDKSP